MNNFVIFKSEGDSHKMSLKNVKLVRDGGYGYALDATWVIETPERIQELHIPRIWLPIKNHVMISSDSDYLYGDMKHKADIGFGYQNIGFSNSQAYTLTTIKEKTKEMTLAEIEKKLGHKVKIVNR